MKEAQSLAVKRAQVEFHNFASLGEPERALRVYAEENHRRGGMLRRHMGFIGSVSPFLEIGANAGHTSYLLCNEFGADGFALDLSADALRHGITLQQEWGMPKAPVRMAGDALNLPFQDNSLQLVLAYQMLSQFLNIETVFLEVKRVLKPGGVFVFAEEPIRRILSLHLYRCPYYDTMKPWERKLFDWGLLGYLVKDVIGADQEESFGIRQNHRMGLNDWRHLIEQHFTDHEYEVFVSRRGWGERAAYQAARLVDRFHSEWVPARLLGGTLAAFCRKAGDPGSVSPGSVPLESALSCPDCRSAITRGSNESLRCVSCDFEAPNEGGVHNLIRSIDRKELYPGDRGDLIDFSQAGHERYLVHGWYELEGVFGNKYRWIGDRAAARLTSTRSGTQLLRIRGFAHPRSFEQGEPVRVEVLCNGRPAGTKVLERSGIFIFEAEVQEAAEHLVEIRGSPWFRMPPDERVFTLIVSMVRLVARE